MSAAVRMRRLRERRRDGVLAVIPIEIDRDTLDMLIRRGYLSVGRDEDGCPTVSRAAIAEAIEDFLASFASQPR